jgi:hypothetical protein
MAGRYHDQVIRVLIGLGVAGVMLVLNLRSSRDSLTFEEHFFEEAFGPSCGWPVKAAAPANEAGVRLVRASVVQGGTTIYLHAFEDRRYPHLAVNWVSVVIDAGVAAFFIAAAVLLPGFFRRTRRSADVP